MIKNALENSGVIQSGIDTSMYNTDAQYYPWN